VARQTEKQLLTSCSSVGLQTLLLVGHQMCITDVDVLFNPQQPFSHADVFVSTTKASCTPDRHFVCTSNLDVSSSISLCCNLVAADSPSNCRRPHECLHASYSKHGNGACVMQVPASCKARCLPRSCKVMAAIAK